VPPVFNVLVRKMMAKQPERRFASAAELREALLAWADDEPVLPLDRAEDSHYQEAVVALETAEGPADVTGDEIPDQPEPARSAPRRGAAAKETLSLADSWPDSRRFKYAVGVLAAALALAAMVLFGLALYLLAG